jgi:hypothetical protein
MIGNYLHAVRWSFFLSPGVTRFNQQLKFFPHWLLGSIKKQSGLAKAIQQTELAQVFFYFNQGTGFLYFWSGIKSISPYRLLRYN